MRVLIGVAAVLYGCLLLSTIASIVLDLLNLAARGARVRHKTGGRGLDGQAGGARAEAPQRRAGV